MKYFRELSETGAIELVLWHGTVHAAMVFADGDILHEHQDAFGWPSGADTSSTPRWLLQDSSSLKCLALEIKYCYQLNSPSHRLPSPVWLEHACKKRTGDPFVMR